MSAIINKIVEKRIKAIVETMAMMFSVNQKSFLTKLFKSVLVVLSTIPSLPLSNGPNYCE